MDINFAVPCLLGLEAPIAEELRNMEAADVRAENGRVLFSGDENILARANICSRFSERVLVLLGSFEAHSFEELFQGTRALPWEQWIGADDAFPVKGYSIDSDLFSVRDCQAIIKKAVVERLKQKYSVEWFEESGPVYQIQFSIMKNKVSLMLDTSGAGLHKRGYRQNANDAPIKETLAASLCWFSRLRPIIRSMTYVRLGHDTYRGRDDGAQYRPRSQPKLRRRALEQYSARCVVYRARACARP